MRMLRRPPFDDPATPGDARLLNRVRWRLVAWSGAITLAILLVLGGAIYATTSANLANTTETALQTRAAAVAAALQRLARPLAPGDADVYSTIGLAIGGPASGTIGTIVTPSNVAYVPRDAIARDLPVEAAVQAVRSSGAEDLRVEQLGGTSARVLSVPVDLPNGRYVIQVVAFRTAEESTLRTLLLVLLVGGFGALILALAGGWLYAQRALVPIRESLRRQREFAADASHELRTPITILRASIDDLQRHPEMPVAQVGTALEDMHAEVGHMTDLVDGLLVLARADSGVVELQHEPADLADAAAAALGELTPLAQERGVELSLDAVPTDVNGDFARLRQMSVILIDNAIRHGGNGIQVGVSVRREGASALLRVDDNGPGLVPGEETRVFERFWRGAGAPEGGLGLGLAIASWIVERHGGTISAAQRPGGGARFEVRIPVSA
jgi:two-component system sensor histidine kinase CiaH